MGQVNTGGGGGGGTSYNFGTGLTNISGTVTANLNTGTPSGQVIYGGVSAGESLTFSSTKNATKGNILFGTSTYDEVNNRLGVGYASGLTFGLQVASNAFVNSGIIANRSNPSFDFGALFFTRGTIGSTVAIGQAGTFVSASLTYGLFMSSAASTSTGAYDISISVGGKVGVGFKTLTNGGAVTPDARFMVKGLTTDNSDYCVKFKDGNETTIYSLRNDGLAGVGMLPFDNNTRLSLKGIGLTTQLGYSHFQSDGATLSFSTNDQGDGYFKKSVTIAGLTPGGVPIISTGGLLAYDSNITWNGAQFSLTSNSNGGTQYSENKSTASTYGCLYGVSRTSNVTRVLTGDAAATGSIRNGTLGGSGLCQNILALDNMSSGALAAGAGSGMSFSVKGLNRGFMEMVMVTIGAGSEDSRFNFLTMASGALVNPLSVAKDKVIVTGKLNISSIPTSSAGLTTGDIWSNAGVLNIV